MGPSAKYRLRLLTACLASATSLSGAVVPDPGLAVPLSEAALLASLPSPADPTSRADIDLPLGRGGAPVRFRVRASGSLSAGLALRVPQLRAYVGEAVDASGRRLRLEYGPSRGFTAAGYEGHVLTRTLEARAPARGARRRGYVLRERSGDRGDGHAGFACATGELPAGALTGRSAAGRVGADCRLLRYRLAVATTGEYARAVAGEDATPAAVLAEVNVAVNRVNEILERDLGITLALIDESTRLVFVDPAADPFDPSEADILLARDGQAAIDSLVTAAAYDVGHVFHAPPSGANGIAQPGGPCRDGAKGVALTGTADPTSERFYVDYLAHELGHQFGAHHTAANDCLGQRNRATALEPGSGSTIMGYAGVCAPNVQSRSDDYFHAVSIAEVERFLATGGSACAVEVAGDNAAPAVSVPDSPPALPRGTPFALRAVGSDPDGDRLTYTWEQFDAPEGAAVALSDTNATGPLFRSLPPSPSPERRFPAGAPPAYDYPGFEILPAVGRELTFRVTARDNHPGGGCAASADVSLAVAPGTGPFRVTAFPAVDTLTAGEQVSVTWDVAGTSTAPIGAQLVDVALSLDGGRTDSLVALAATPNDGQATVTVPAVATDAARWVVRARDNVFFAVSAADLTVVPAVAPGFSLGADTVAVASCGLAAAYDLTVGGVGGFDAPIRLRAVGLPPGATARFAVDAASGDFASRLSLALADSLAPGTYGFRVVAEGGGLSRALDLTLRRLAVPASAPALTRPADGADVGSPATALTWTRETGAGDVRVEVSREPDFPPERTLVREVDADRVDFDGLRAGVYFARVAYANPCGRGPWGGVRSFRRLGLARATFASTEAVPIDPDVPNVAVSTLDVARAGTVFRIEAAVAIRHTYVSDLDARLVLPGGDTIRLFDAVDDCDERDLVAAFADTAATELAATIGVCGAGVDGPSIEGTFRPATPFADALPREAVGTYTLLVRDALAQDGGAVLAWELALWFAEGVADSLTVVADTVALLPGRATAVTAERLRASGPEVSADSLAWVVKALPGVGTVSLGGRPLAVGEAFAQADVDAGALAFSHEPSAALGTGALLLDLIGPRGAYRANVALPVAVARSTLAAELAPSSGIACAGDADAALVATARGGTPPYAYSFNGAPFAREATFAGLGPGVYVAVVRDALGSLATTDGVAVAEPPPLRLAADVEGDRVVAAGSGGVPPLRYGLGGGALRPSGTFTAVADGTYDVLVRDANGCTAATEIVVANVPTLGASVRVAEEIACAGGTAEILAVATGGRAPYAYALDGGPPQPGGAFASVGAGRHVVAVTDARGARAEAAFALASPTPLAATASVDERAVALGASGGTPPYRFRLGDGAFGAGSTFGDLPDGTYRATVRDRAGCEIEVAFAIDGPEPPPVVTSVATLTGATCAGVADARVVVAAERGVPPYSFRLADGTSSGPGGVFGGLAAGAYSVTAIDSAGVASAPFAFAIDEPAPLTLTARADGAEVVLTAAGGTAPYAYRLAEGPPRDDPRFGPLPAGSYGFAVRDANGCRADAAVEVGDAGLDVAVTLTLARESCPGSADGAVTLRGVGGREPYGYSLDGTDYRSADFFGGLAPGTYAAYVRDGLGNVATRDFAIAAQSDPSYALEVRGSRVSVTGGSAGERPMYSFDGGDTFGPDSVGFLYVAGPAEVFVRVGGCEVALPVVVSEPLAIEAAVATACAERGDAALDLCVSGGVGGYDVEVSAGAVTPVVSPACGSGGYLAEVPAGLTFATVTVTDSAGARVQREVAVVEAPAFAVELEVAAGTLRVVVAGGTAPYTYALDGGEPQASPSFPAPPDGEDAVVTVRDSFGCVVAQNLLATDVTAFAGGDLGLRIYPNPARDVLHVLTDRPREVASAELYDPAGRRVASAAGPTARAPLRLPVDALGPGVYVLRVRYRDGVATASVVVR